MIPEAILERTTSRFPRFDRERVRIEPLEKGGSGRKFYRIAVAGEGSLILVRYTDQREENRHYCHIAAFLEAADVSTPAFYHHDSEEGLIWMEDLGELDLWHFRHAPWEERRELYRATLREAVGLHTRGHVILPTLKENRPTFQQAFDADLYRWEQNYFFQYCLERHFGVRLEETEAAAARPVLDAIAERLAALPRVLVHRDFQSQNILIRKEGGERPVVLIDFQGMRPGLPQYDLASLLYDPYVPFTPEERDSLLGDYILLCAEAGFAVPADFRTVYDWCAMQRLMQALGAYGFLGHTQERPDFLTHIPAALASLDEVLGRIEGAAALRTLVSTLKANP
ncbi:MAG TPA: phosphotransferase [Chthoniobacteraceae bacterium]|nr:phosphotransferase [Chthoniobacteraceae bacterium]